MTVESNPMVRMRWGAAAAQRGDHQRRRPQAKFPRAVSHPGMCLSASRFAGGLRGVGSGRPQRTVHVAVGAVIDLNVPKVEHVLDRTKGLDRLRQADGAGNRSPRDDRPSEDRHGKDHTLFVPPPPTSKLPVAAGSCEARSSRPRVRDHRARQAAIIGPLNAGRAHRLNQGVALRVDPRRSDSMSRISVRADV